MMKDYKEEMDAEEAVRVQKKRQEIADRRAPAFTEGYGIPQDRFDENHNVIRSAIPAQYMRGREFDNMRKEAPVRINKIDQLQSRIQRDSKILEEENKEQ